MMIAYFHLYMNLLFFLATAFVPHPVVRLGGQAGNSDY